MRAAPTTEDFVEFECRTGIQLPNDYREFLAKASDWHPSARRFDVPGWPGGFSYIGDVFYLHSGPSNLVSWQEELADRLPKGVLAIASDPGGNFICIGTTGDDVGRIFYWDASPDWGLSEQTGNMFAISDGIEPFIDKLY